VPELPEVETVRRHLAPLVEGARITHARIDDPRLTRPFDPRLVARELVGEHIAQVDRRGKYVVVRFSSGRALVAHLRMTGSFRHVPRGSSRYSHVRAVLMMDNGSNVVYRDVRRFGTWELLEAVDIDPYLAARLGPEPLDPSLTARRLGARLAGRKAPIKAALLDQRVLAGLGNIYVDEALWHARVHPLRSACDVSPHELERLFRAIRKALRLGLERQGATLRDYAQPDGSAGSMQDEFRAYGRAGEPCDRCRAPLERIVVGGRGTTFCPRCQLLSPPG
jgi:formamidopyrimidine-DNA glycosylase